MLMLMLPTALVNGMDRFISSLLLVHSSVTRIGEGYFQDKGIWVLGFWDSTGSAFVALLPFLGGTKRYRHFKPRGNPLARFSQVRVAAAKNWKEEMPAGEVHNLHEEDGNEKSIFDARKMLHTNAFKLLDRAAVTNSPVFLAQSLAPLSPFPKLKRIPPASMSIFNILSVAVFIFLYRRVIDPHVSRIRKNKGQGQLEFFNAQAPGGLKSIDSTLHISSLLVFLVTKFSTVDNMPGWIPGNLNRGHLDRFYFLLAGLTTVDLVLYIACAKWYKRMKLGKDNEDGQCGV
ncbi:unnamed protein product [Fraxinus pennsylvanica]|uniref:Uncharacterized protein n=1 Tax=Fraxinus pennsylvanica TaxID=56036 RepID=A0AAD2A870_9LAMI|nr:unnamed protein product [Fraxinus pennsylvanica]